MLGAIRREIPNIETTETDHGFTVSAVNPLNKKVVYLSRMWRLERDGMMGSFLAKMDDAEAIITHLKGIKAYSRTPQMA